MNQECETGSIVGMDGHLRTCDLCGIDHRGKVIRRFSEVPSRPEDLAKAFGVLPPPLTLVLEESAMAQWFVEQLSPLVHRVVVVDPTRNRLIAEADAKTDRIDAFKLADLFRIGAVSPVFHSIDPARTDFRRATQQYESIMRETVKVKNRIRKIFNSLGLDPSAKIIYSQRRRHEAFDHLPESARLRLDTWYRLLDELCRARLDMLKLLRRLSKPFDEVARFQTIPGVGFVTACEFSAFLQSPDRFQTKSKLCAYARLAVVERSSAGQPIGRRHLSPHGLGVLKSATRTAFIGSARRSGGRNAVWRYYIDLRAHCLNPTHARLTTQRKILYAAWAMWKRKEVFDPDRFMTTHTQRV